jgi:hypothetical protein
VVEVGQRLDLALEATEVVGAAAREQLDRRRATEHGVAGAVDDAHAALAELALEGVLAQPARVADVAAQT